MKARQKFLKKLKKKNTILPAFTFLIIFWNERLEELASRFGTDSAPYKKCFAEIELLKQDKRYLKITDW